VQPLTLLDTNAVNSDINADFHDDMADVVVAITPLNSITAHEPELTYEQPAPHAPNEPPGNGCCSGGQHDAHVPVVAVGAQPGAKHESGNHAFNPEAAFLAHVGVAAAVT